MNMSLSEASKAVQKSKQTLLNAINAGRLSASKDHQGQWRIDASELLRAYPVATIGAIQFGRDETDKLDGLDGELRDLRARLDAANEVKGLLARQVDDLRRERDQWQLQAERLLLALPGGLAPPPDPGAACDASGGRCGGPGEVGQGEGHAGGESAKKRGWWSRLFMGRD